MEIKEAHIDFAERLAQVLIKRGIVFSSPWMSPGQAARYCGLSQSYLGALRSRGQGPKFRRIGEPKTTKEGKRHNKILYFKDDLDQWLKLNDRE